MSSAVEHVTAHVLKRRGAGPLLIGICGSQGSGKSTLAAAVVTGLAAQGVRAAVFSLDDLYLDREARVRLAEAVHPLLITRGPPGTHDVALGLELLEAFRRGEALRLPRFDKAADAVRPRESWPTEAAGLEVLVFEGWCVGARPEAEEALAGPVNTLEATRDADGRWRRYVNGALAGPYAPLFATLDSLVLLAAPAWEVVPGWRVEQEQGNAAANPGGRALMSPAEIAVFVQHYERLTRRILSEMPARADLVLRLDEARRVLGVDEPWRRAPG